VFFHREEYKRLLLEILDQLSKLHKDQGDWETMQKYAWMYLKYAPLEEQAYRRVIELLALSGRRSAALEQYQLFVNMLQQELGVDPSPETVRLYDRIRLGKPINIDIAEDSHSAGVLPRSITEFIGREDELDYLARCFADTSCQLISINGLPGVGKSRLAIEAAQRHQQNYRDGIFYVSFEGMHSEELFYPALARTLGLTISLVNPKLQLARFLEAKRCIILLDQFDEMHNAAQFLMDLLQNAHQLKIIVTSRQRLSLLAANLLTLEGLPYPLDPSDSQALKSPAVQLFLKRARTSRLDLAQNPSLLYYVLELCQAVDGNPLALELAADRLRELSLPYIVDALHKDLSVLTTRYQDLPARQHSINEILTGIWQKLDDAAQKQLEALAIFPCSFTPQAAEQLCLANQDVLAFFSDQSLLFRVGYGRYALKPLVRLFALDRLSSQPERKAALQMIFSNYFTVFLHTKVNHLQTSRSPAQLLSAIDEELENIDYALDWAFWFGDEEMVKGAVDDLQQYRDAHQTFSAQNLPSSDRQPETPAYFLDSLAYKTNLTGGAGCPHHHRLVDAKNALLLVDKEGTISAANYQAQQLSGLPLGILLGMNLHDLGLEDPSPGLFIQHPSGALTAVKLLSLPVRDREQGQHLILLKNLDHSPSEETAALMLPGQRKLPGLVQFSETLRSLISDASQARLQLGVLVLSIDGLPAADKRSHQEIQQQCLQQAARRIQENLRQTDTLAYLGERDFGVIVDRLPHPQMLETIAARLAAKFQAPLVCGDHDSNYSLLHGCGVYHSRAGDF